MSRKNRSARRHSISQKNNSVTGQVTHGNLISMAGENCSVEFAQLPSSVLESDSSYQRPLDAARVARIVEKFDFRLVNPVKVSVRDGHFHVFDGAHTLAALKELHKASSFPVACMIYHGLTYEDEAYLFALQRGDSKEVAAAERLKAMLISNEPKTHDFRRRTEDAGFQLTTSGASSNGKLACVAKLRKLYDADPDLYSATLSLLMDTWHGKAWSLGANIIGGLFMFLSAFGDAFSHDRFVKYVGAADPEALDTAMSGIRGSRDYCYAWAILSFYNKVGGRGALRPFPLYNYVL